MGGDGLGNKDRIDFLGVSGGSSAIIMKEFKNPDDLLQSGKFAIQE